ncbi:MAG: D-sedoheptulose 7-phosphate isomerase [Candidatus Euphemobacter frigidus]|nr:D-sedoheptulose 7-phosphate isomerase [Candidatus Euphemobacter frigidus]MDP8274928.1 D-sedoheptulose 7-phosphate isomerase [Candidatus Euphemobacter frigidus]
MEEKILSTLEEGLRLREKLKELTPRIARAAHALIDCLKGGGKILICGNGGSAADSQHIAAELVGRFKRERKALPVIALSTDTSILTSIANDYSFDRVFSRQVEALGRPGDLLIMISTSGNSANLLQAAMAAREDGLGTLAFLGRDGGELAGKVDLSIIVPSSDTARIQEGHTVIYHIICGLVEEAFAK